MMRNNALPGEYVELEVRFTDHPGSSGVNRQFWYNARSVIEQQVEDLDKTFRTTGSLVRGNDSTFMPPPLPPSHGAIRPVYPYSFTGYPQGVNQPANDRKAYKILSASSGFSGPILRTYSQYVSDSVASSEIGGGTFRRQVDADPARRPDRIQWQLKHTNPNNIYDSPNHWMRITTSTEAPSHPPPLSGVPVYRRYIARHSFYLANTRVDFSKVYSVGGQNGPVVTHEIEVEYIPNTGLPLDTFLNVVKDVTRGMFKTPLLFSRADLFVVSKVVNARMREGFDQFLTDVPYVNRALLSEAQALRSFMLNSAYLFGTGVNERVYNISLKIDGYRAVYIVDPQQGTWTTYPPFQANFCCNTPEHNTCALTVFEGEISRDPSTGIEHFWYIDAMVVNGENLRERFPWTMRKLKFQSWYNDAPRELFQGAPPIQTNKPTVSVRRRMEGTNIFTVMEGLWAGRGNLLPLSPVDGLIFTPELSSYNDACTSVAHERIIFKWKDEVTIDLLIRRTKLGGIDLFMRGANNEEVAFRGSTKVPFRGRIIMGDIPIINDSVVEFRYDAGNLVAYRLRLEKSGPNNVGAVESNWTVSADPANVVTEADLLCKSATLMRKSHNRIAKSLISQGAGKVLDIGLGRFGGASKYEEGNYDMILGIDPYGDIADMQEAHDRLRGMSQEFQSKVHIRQMGGQETDKVVAFVMEMTQGEGVDVIAMMDSLTFFFDPDRAMLDALVQTIKRCLKPNGVFIWRAMYGEKVLDHMRSIDVTRLSFGTADYLEYFPDQQQLHVEITPRISQREYIVRMQELKSKTGLVGETFCASDEPLLSQDYLVFSRFFCHGTMTYSDALKYPPALSEIFGVQDTVAPSPGVARVAKTRGRLSTTSSRVLIEAVEKLFTTESHAKLVSKYWQVSRHPDPMYLARGDSEPAPTLFETAAQCYFSDVYLANVVIFSSSAAVPTESEIFNTVPQTVDAELQRSLALSYILGIDIFVFSSAGDFIDTNSLQESSNPCMIAVYDDGVYTIKRAGAIFPFHHRRDLEAQWGVSAHTLQPVDLPAFYRACGINDVVLLHAVRTETNVLERVSHADTILEDVRLQLLANTLVRQHKKSSDATDIERIGITVRDDTVQIVDEMMAILQE